MQGEESCGDLIVLGDMLHVGGGVDRLHADDGVESPCKGKFMLSSSQ